MKLVWKHFVAKYLKFREDMLYMREKKNDCCLQKGYE